MRTEVFTFHGYAEMWLGGHWVKGSPAFDQNLCLGLGLAPLDFGMENTMLCCTPMMRKDRVIWSICITTAVLLIFRMR